MNNPNISWIAQIYYQLPIFLRKQKLIRFLKSAYSALISLYEGFISFRNERIFRLRYTGQVIYMEHMLNSRFNNGQPAYIDGTPNGIYIGEGAITFDPAYIFQKSEGLEDGRWLYRKSETPDAPEDVIWLYKKTELATLNYNFTVNIPIALFDITTNEELVNAVKAWVNYYKQAGKTFILQNY